MVKAETMSESEEYSSDEEGGSPKDGLDGVYMGGMADSSMDGGANARSRGSRAKRSCAPCRAARRACSNTRPCKRCTAKGMPDKCIEGNQLPSGRPPRPKYGDVGGVETVLGSPAGPKMSPHRGSQMGLSGDSASSSSAAKAKRSSLNASGVAAGRVRSASLQQGLSGIVGGGNNGGSNHQSLMSAAAGLADMNNNGNKAHLQNLQNFALRAQSQGALGLSNGAGGNQAMGRMQSSGPQGSSYFQAGGGMKQQSQPQQQQQQQQQPMMMQTGEYMQRLMDTRGGSEPGMGGAGPNTSVKMSQESMASYLMQQQQQQQQPPVLGTQTISQFPQLRSSPSQPHLGGRTESRESRGGNQSSGPGNVTVVNSTLGNSFSVVAPSAPLLNMQDLNSRTAFILTSTDLSEQPTPRVSVLCADSNWYNLSTKTIQDMNAGMLDIRNMIMNSFSDVMGTRATYSQLDSNIATRSNTVFLTTFMRMRACLDDLCQAQIFTKCYVERFTPVPPISDEGTVLPSITWDNLMRVIDVNSAMLKLLGCTLEDVCGDVKMISELPIHEQRNMMAYVQVIITQLPVAFCEVNLTFMTKYGSPINTRAHISCVRSMPEGRLAYCVGVMTPQTM